MIQCSMHQLNSSRSVPVLIGFPSPDKTGIKYRQADCCMGCRDHRNFDTSLRLILASVKIKLRICCWGMQLECGECLGNKQYTCVNRYPLHSIYTIRNHWETGVKCSNVTTSDGVDAAVVAIPSACQCSVVHARRFLHAEQLFQHVWVLYCKCGQ
jgi:hypothetical protein